MDSGWGRNRESLRKGKGRYGMGKAEGKRRRVWGKGMRRRDMGMEAIYEAIVPCSLCYSLMFSLDSASCILCMIPAW